MFNLKRGSIGAYEEGRAEAKIDTVIEIAEYFQLSLDQLLKKELTINEIYHISERSKNLHKIGILEEEVDKTNKKAEKGKVTDTLDNRLFELEKKLNNVESTLAEISQLLKQSKKNKSE